MPPVPPGSYAYDIYKRGTTYTDVGPHIQMWDHIYKRGTTYTSVGSYVQMWDHIYKCGITQINGLTHMSITVLRISMTYRGQAPSVQVSTDLLVC